MIKIIFSPIVVLFSTLAVSYGQTWIVPANGSGVSQENNKIGITGTSPTQGHLQIVADNKSEIQFYTGNIASKRMTITTDGKIGIGTSNPTVALDINGGANSYLKISRVTSSRVGPVYGECGIMFENGASLKQNVFPNYGSGSLNIKNSDEGGSIISLYKDEIDFGGLLGQNVSAGKFNFNNLVWAKRLYISDYSKPDSGQYYSMPNTFRFAVNGTSSFQDKVVIGDLPAFTKGIPATGYKLFVSDGILAEKVKCAIKTTDNWSDFVFSPDYKLMELKEVETYIGQNKHLPGVPSAETVVENGIDLAEMNALLLQKIEELTLHLIRMEKENKKILQRLDAQ